MQGMLQASYGMPDCQPVGLSPPISKPIARCSPLQPIASISGRAPEGQQRVSKIQLRSPRRAGLHRRLVQCSADSGQTAAAPSVSESLSEADREAWQAVQQRVQSLGFDAAEAERMMIKAFGWGSQAYWRKSKVEEVPDLAKVQASLDYLRQLGVSEDAKLAKVVKGFPEVLGCGVDDQLKKAVEVLEKTWKMKGPVVANTVMRRPQILGFNYDCEGDCAGECNRCWVRF